MKKKHTHLMIRTETPLKVNPYVCGKKRMSSECSERDVLDVSIELLFAAAGPVVAMEGRLNQRSHDAAHAGLISAAVALAVMLHA